MQGNRVYGFYFDKLTSDELKESFDRKHPIDSNLAPDIRTPQKPYKEDGNIIS